MLSPIPILKDVLPIMNSYDLRFIMEKLGRDKLIELFDNMGIILQGTTEEILNYCAYVISWDYTTTKRLRDMYALSEDANHVTGFLIQADAEVSLKTFYNKLSYAVKWTRKDSINDENLQGITRVTQQNDNLLECRFRYNRSRVKSDLSMFRDTPIDTRLFIYDTGLKWNIDHALFCVLIQPTTSSDYAQIRDEFVKMLKREELFQCRIRVLSLKAPIKNPSNCFPYFFRNCSSSNQFMMGLLENPVMAQSKIRDVPSIEMFRWNREVESPEEANLVESVNVEEDLDHHIKDFSTVGVSLHKAKTILAALAKDKHAASAMSVVYKIENQFIYSQISFKIKNDGLEVSIGKISEEIAPNQERKIYDSDLYWKILWEHWNDILRRYIETMSLHLSENP